MYNQGMSITLRWLGNAGFEFTPGGQVLLIDPFLTRPKRRNIYFGQVAPDTGAIATHVTRCDHILVSHAHFDHFMDAPEIARRTGAIIHGSRNTCALARALGVPAAQIKLIRSGDEFTLGDIAVRAIPAAHPWIPGYTSGKLADDVQEPLRLRDYRMDDCLSFLITYKETRILVWSSTRTAGALPADTLICRAVSGTRWYENMLRAVNPRLVIPSHWDDMFAPLSEPPRPFFSPPKLALPPLRRIDLGEFARKARLAKADCEALVPDRFRQYTLYG